MEGWKAQPHTVYTMKVVFSVSIFWSSFCSILTREKGKENGYKRWTFYHLMSGPTAHQWNSLSPSFCSFLLTVEVFWVVCMCVCMGYWLPSCWLISLFCIFILLGVPIYLLRTQVLNWVLRLVIENCSALWSVATNNSSWLKSSHSLVCLLLAGACCLLVHCPDVSFVFLCR